MEEFIEHSQLNDQVFTKSKISVIKLLRGSNYVLIDIKNRSSSSNVEWYNGIIYSLCVVIVLLGIYIADLQAARNCIS